jgi:hypothetical protein
MLYPLGLLLPILISLIVCGIFKSWTDLRGKNGTTSTAVFGVSWFLCMYTFLKIVRWLECRNDIAAYGECPPRAGHESMFEVLYFIPGSIVLSGFTFLIAYFLWFRKPSKAVNGWTKAVSVLPALVAAMVLAALIKSNESAPFQLLEKSDDGLTYLLVKDFGHGKDCGLLVDETSAGR